MTQPTEKTTDSDAMAAMQMGVLLMILAKVSGPFLGLVASIGAVWYFGSTLLNIKVETRPDTDEKKPEQT